MIFFINSIGHITPIAPDVPQGGNFQNTLVVVAPLIASTSATVHFKLPNGIITEKHVMRYVESGITTDNGLKVCGWGVYLPESITAVAGEVTAQVSWYRGEAVITTYALTFHVQAGVPYLPETASATTVEQILALLSEMKTYVDNNTVASFLVENNDVDNVDFVPNGYKKAPAVYENFVATPSMFMAYAEISSNVSGALFVYEYVASGGIRHNEILETANGQYWRTLSFSSDKTVTSSTLFLPLRTKVVQSTGDSITSVMSQKAVSDIINSLLELIDGLRDMQEILQADIDGVADIAARNSGNIADLKAVVPSEATSSNKLADKSWVVNKIIEQLSGAGLSMLVVDALPTENISTRIIYLVPTDSGSSGNIYEEYVYINGEWEVLGTTQIDLSDYTPNGGYTGTAQDLKDDISGLQTDISGLQTDIGNINTVLDNINGEVI